MKNPTPLQKSFPAISECILDLKSLNWKNENL